MTKRFLLLVALVGAFAAATLPASANPSACLTTSITVNGTAAPTNGTTCLP